MAVSTLSSCTVYSRFNNCIVRASCNIPAESVCRFGIASRQARKRAKLGSPNVNHSERRAYRSSLVSYFYGRPVQRSFLPPESLEKRAALMPVAGIDLFVLNFEGVLADESGSLRQEVKEALKATEMPYYLVTRLDPVVVSNTLQEGAGIDIPAVSPRILADAGGSLAVLKAVSERPLAADPTTTLHYVDSSVAVLEQVAADEALNRWQLYHATWAESLEGSVGAVPPILLTNLEQFGELLKWGLLMGVNDGCQEYEDGTPST